MRRSISAAMSMAVAVMGSVLGPAFAAVYDNPSAHKRTKTLFPQSKASKQFHLERADAKRARKAAILHGRVASGNMEYSDAHMQRHNMTRLGKSEVFLGDNKIGTAKQVYIETKPEVRTDGTTVQRPDLAEMTVPQLIAYGKEIGAKVTTKMVKTDLIEAIDDKLLS